LEKIRGLLQKTVRLKRLHNDLEDKPPPLLGKI
jgi:hypothetical protein